MKFKIEDNLFDSGIIAPKVGNLVLEDYSDIDREDGSLIANHAKKENYSFIALGTETPVDLEGFVPMGVIHELEAKVSNAWENICNIPDMFNIRPLTGSDWNQVKELMDVYPPNRYSKDSNLKIEQVINHKLAILKHLAKNYPPYALGAFSKQNELLGFHFLRLGDDDIMFLQELLVKPNYRVGFVSLQLVKENLNTVMKNTKIKCLATRVYEDNHVSINFFNKLGFVKVRKKEYYYHMWI